MLCVFGKEPNKKNQKNIVNQCSRKTLELGILFIGLEARTKEKFRANNQQVQGVEGRGGQGRKEEDDRKITILSLMF